jgi:hypothetical protein
MAWSIRSEEKVENYQTQANFLRFSNSENWPALGPIGTSTACSSANPGPNWGQISVKKWENARKGEKYREVMLPSNL